MASVIAAGALAGRRALVTGSTSGIGLGMACELARAGASVAVTGLGSQDEIGAARTSVQQAASDARAKVTFVPSDLLSQEGLGAKQLVAAAGESLGGHIDILVNNAGMQHVAPVHEFDEGAYYRLMALNLHAPFWAMSAALPAMRAAGWGRIVNVASVHGLVGSTGKAPYVASKHALVGATKVAALESAGTGVTVNAICPGWVLTPLVAAQITARAQADGMSEEEAKAKLLQEKQPSGDFASVQQLGQLAAFLASDAAGQITGASYTMDGGWTAQ